MTLQSGLLPGLFMTLSACTLPPERPSPPSERPTPRAVQTEPAVTALVNELARISALSTEQRRRELAELEGNRLDDARRFQLAALLERDDNLDALERSLKNLSALNDLDTRSQSLVDLMKRSLKARIDNKQLNARNTELQDKLEQIKTLEKSLQQRNAPLKSP